MLVAMARRLPVIQSPPPEDAEALARPAWHWVLIGAGFTLTLWLPLATLAVWVASRILVVLSFVIAAFLAGALVGRFGPRAALRHVALAGFVGGAAGFLLAALGGGLSPWPVAVASFVALVVTGSSFALLGGWLIRRARRGKL